MGRTCLSTTSWESSSVAARAQISFEEDIKVRPTIMHKGVFSMSSFMSAGESVADLMSLPAETLDLL